MVYWCLVTFSPPMSVSEIGGVHAVGRGFIISQHIPSIILSALIAPSALPIPLYDKYL